MNVNSFLSLVIALMKGLFMLLLCNFSKCLISNTIGSTATECDTFTNICTMNTIDQSILVTSSTANSYITIPIAGEYYISFNMPVNIFAAYIDLSILYGYITIFVSVNKKPTITNYDYTNMNTNQMDYLMITSLNHKKTDKFNVLFKAFSEDTPTYFSGIIYSGGMNPISLKEANGLPITLRMGEDAYRKYQFPIKSTNSIDIVVTSYVKEMPIISVLHRKSAKSSDLTPLPNYYYSNTTNIKEGYISFTPSTQDLNSMFILQLKSTNMSYINFALRLGYSSTTTTSSTSGVHDPALAGSSSHTIVLLVGQPVIDTVEEQEEHYYVLYVPPGISSDISISVDPIQGDADLFVNPESSGFYHRAHEPSSEPAIWTSQKPSGTDSVSITKKNSAYIFGGGAYYITVFGYKRAHYMLRSSVSDTATLLVDGYSIEDSVPAGKYKYYRYHDTDQNHDLYFDVLPYTGDADIAISCEFNPTGDDSGTPSILSGHNNFFSGRYLEDTIVVHNSDPNRCSGTANTGGLFYIAVYGYRESTFSINVQHDFGERVLVAGLAQSNTIFKQMSQRFKIRVGFEVEDLTVRLNPLYGDCDLYAKMNSEPQIFDYDYHSNNEYLEEDSILIPEKDICDDCWIHILVYGYETTRYSLLASFEDGTITLFNGVPQIGSVSSDHIQYYSYPIQSSCTITTVLTVSSGVAPALHISNVMDHPDSGTPDTIHRLSGEVTGIGLLPRLDFIHGVKGDWLYIGVDGAGHNATYTIRVYETTNDPEAPPTLLMLPTGKPQEDDIKSDAVSKWLYYQIPAPLGHDSITIRSVMEVGYIELYVTQCKTDVSKCASYFLPNTTNYLQTTAGHPDRTYLTIERNDPKPSIYLVGVKSTSFYSAYQVSASFESTILSLQAGIAVLDHVNMDESNYFSFFLNQQPFVKIKIALTVISGDPDLYISLTSQHPSFSNSTWRSSLFGPDTLTIDPTHDPEACRQCTYYIAVVGARESTYTISVSISSSIPKLSDGIPSVGYVSPYEWVYYSFHNVYADSRDIHISLISTTGNADVYITLDGSMPSLVNYMYGSAKWSSTDDVTIIHTDGAYQSACVSASTIDDCVIIVGVYGSSAAEYTVTLTSSSSAKLLQLEVVTIDTVAFQQNNYYRVLLNEDYGSDEVPSTLRFSFAMYSGHIDVYISCKSMQPNITNSQWSLLSDDMVGQSGSEMYLDVFSVTAIDKGCHVLMSGNRKYMYFYATIQGTTAARYSIVASILEDSIVPLLRPGISSPIKQIVAESVDYYFIRPGTTYDDMHIMITTISGHVDLYLSGTWDTKPILIQGKVQSYLLTSANNIGNEDIAIKSNWIETHCMKRSYCYYIIAIVNSFESSARYTIQASLVDTAILLSSGVPRISHVMSAHFQYFVYSITQPDLDITIAVTPLTGDPGMAPLYHPTRENFTWFHSSYGADTLTIQSEDIATKCNAKFHSQRSCDMNIGVYGFVNTTFSLLVTMNDGFNSPIRLLDQTPQSGSVSVSQYAYYQYTFSDPYNQDDSLPKLDVKFVLTPTSDGDVDLFLIIEKPGQHIEPGVNHYDYRSIGYGSVTEQIEISSTSEHYCSDCVVYLAVYGYRASSYTLQASSSGMIRMQASHALGGHVDSQKIAYYSFHNHYEFATLIFTLTMILADADLYIIEHKPGTPWIYPSKTQYTWRSVFVGNDNIKITYEDYQYCFDCEYLIGVFGYSNSTYTLLVTDQEESVVKLVQNRPQIASIKKAGDIMYFSVVIESSSADTTISLTSLNTGYAELYAQVYNLTTFYSPEGGDIYRMPLPTDPSSYSFSTIHTEDCILFLPGPHITESLIVIAVQAIDTELKFSMVATSGHSSILIQAGIPQNHYVEAGNNEYFKFFPSEDEDLHITVTARSGDPDLFVSVTSQQPHCSIIHHTYYIETTCSNYTWSSRNYLTDQIIISRDIPCTPILPSTYIDDSCDPLHSYQPERGTPVYIGIFAFSTTKFTLLVSPLGQQVKLLAGQPQLSHTTTSVVCSTRSSDGVCLPTSTSKEIQAAYFSFYASPPSQDLTASGIPRSNTLELTSVFDFILSVVPDCNTTMQSSSNSDTSSISDRECSLGCDCAPLTIYMNSCPLSKCTVNHHKPSSFIGQHVTSLVVHAGTGSTVFLSRMLDPSTGKKVLCDPSIVGETCAYFISVAGSNPVYDYLESRGATFMITARTPGDVILIPCYTKISSDGIRFLSEDSIQGIESKSHHYYELCSEQYSENTVATTNDGGGIMLLSNENLIIELEQCVGNTKLYACADNNQCLNLLPSISSYGYYSDHTMTCIRSVDKNKKDLCYPIVTNKPTLTLPQKLGNYFLMTEGNGKFIMKVQTTFHNGKKLSPQIVTAGIQTMEASQVIVKQVASTSITITFRQSRVIMPGLAYPLEADYLSYVGYIFDAADLHTQLSLEDIQLSSICGLEYVSGLLPSSSIVLSRIEMTSVERGTDFITHTLENLKPETSYQLVIASTCNSQCLLQLSKLITDPKVLLSCTMSHSSTDIGCRSQSFVYTIIDLRTMKASSKDEAGSTGDDITGTNDKDFIQNLISLSIVTMAILLIILLLVIIYWVKYSNSTYTDNCLSWFGYQNKYQSTNTNSNHDDFDDFNSTHQLPWQFNLKGNRENNTVMEMVNLHDSNNNSNHNNNMYVAPTLNNNIVLEKSYTKQSTINTTTSKNNNNSWIVNPLSNNNSNNNNINNNNHNNNNMKYSVINNNEDIDGNEQFELHL